MKYWKMMSEQLSVPHELPSSYWRDRRHFSGFWSARALEAVKLRSNATFICDIGCGMQALKALLPGAVYLPADLEKWTPEVEACDLNRGLFPEEHLSVAELCFVLGVLEYLRDVEGSLAALSTKAERVILSYNAVDLVNVDRVAHHWLNSFSVDELKAMALRANFQIESVAFVPPPDPQVLLSLRSTKFSKMDLLERDARRFRSRHLLKAGVEPVAIQTPRDPAKPFAFLHLPKTAGTSLQRAFRDLLSPKREIFMHAGMAFGQFKSFETLSPESGPQSYRKPLL
jgi:hypothetical protein